MLISPFLFCSFFTAAENDLRHQGAAAHAQGLFVAAGAGGAHDIAEAFKGLAVPRVLNGNAIADFYFIRTDFVTNSSSASFVLELKLESDEGELYFHQVEGRKPDRY